MKFSILTPTYRRPELLSRSVRSVQAQTYHDWEMIIINDSPTDKGYTEFASSINDPRIRYVENERNMGVNFSRNRALDLLSAGSDWVIFLDDDDYLSPDTLSTFHELIMQHPQQKWFMTNRAYKDGTPATEAPRDDTHYSYARDYLLFRRIQGDATHCITTKLLHDIRFLKNIKQGEEWFFFYQIGLQTRLFYHDHNSTITDGYDADTGLNFRKRTRKEQLKALAIMLYEALERHIAHRPTLLLYLLARGIRSLFKKSNFS